jgi:hypothetical protein
LREFVYEIPANEACISLTNVLKALLFLFLLLNDRKFKITVECNNATLFLIVLLAKLQLYKYN